MGQDLWEASRLRLREQIDAKSFSTWIEPIHVSTYDQGVLSLNVPNTFMADWLQKHFVEMISTSVREVDPECRSVTIMPDPSLKNEAGTLPVSRTEESEADLTAPTAPQRDAAVPSASPSRPRLTNLNARNTFDTFIIGPSNNFAYAAARAVAKSPGAAYNPLFLYGGVGLGKTHLMQAVGHAVWEQNSRANVLYMSSEEFTNQLISSIQKRSTQQFRAKYRSVDVLLIDDIQFIAGRDSTQEEFFHTFNTLYDAHKQIVLSSDRPPKEIPQLEERLVSRFHWGLVTDIQPPDVETRMAILQAKAEQDHVELPHDVAHFIAQTVTSNIRELEGALIRVTAFASMHERPLSLDVAREALEALVPAVAIKPLAIDRIQQVVAAHFDVRIADLKSARRSRQVVQPRQAAMYLCRELTSASLIDIGDAFGGRDHTTVMHACRKVGEEREQDPAMRHTLDMLIKQLQENG